jgi:preprotein translocase subunit SecA
VRIASARFMDVATRDGLDELVNPLVLARYEERERELGTELLRALERHAMLIVIDQQWKDHLLSIDHLKEGIGLRGYGQRDPLMEYKKEAFDLFQGMTERVKAAVVERLFKMQLVAEAPPEMPAPVAPRQARESRGEISIDSGRPAPASPARGSSATPAKAPRTPTGQKIGRNDPCYCGSGKKYKKCCFLKGE